MAAAAVVLTVPMSAVARADAAPVKADSPWLRHPPAGQAGVQFCLYAGDGGYSQVQRFAEVS